MLPDFRRRATLQLRHELGVRFLAAKAEPARGSLDTSDKDPDRYVEQHRG